MKCDEDHPSAGMEDWHLHKLRFTMLARGLFDSQVNRDGEIHQTVLFLNREGHAWAFPFGIN